MKLQNKTIIITGASEGIGKEIALRLAKEKTSLVLIARNEEKLTQVCNQAKELGALNATFYSCDLQDSTQIEKTISAILNDVGTVDVLINNAGIWHKMMPIDEMKPEVIDAVIQTNLSAVIHLTRLLLPHLRSRPEAALLNIISKSGVVAQSGQAAYTASKFGLHGFIEVLKTELKGSSVRVGSVHQSGTNTSMFEKTGEDVPNDKFTEPEDLADVVAFMLSRPKKIWLHDVRVEY